MVALNSMAVTLLAGVLNINTFLGLFFTRFLFPEGGMVGKRAVKYWFILSSLAPVYLPPTI